jgi:hypothetical protein
MFPMLSPCGSQLGTKLRHVQPKLGPSGAKWVQVGPKFNPCCRAETVNLDDVAAIWKWFKLQPFCAFFDEHGALPKLKLYRDVLIRSPAPPRKYHAPSTSAQADLYTPWMHLGLKAHELQVRWREMTTSWLNFTKLTISQQRQSNSSVNGVCGRQPTEIPTHGVDTLALTWRVSLCQLVSLFLFSYRPVHTRTWEGEGWKSQCFEKIDSDL